MIGRRIVFFCAGIALSSGMSGELLAGDWPMWRYDAGHTAASPDDLPESLNLVWSRQYTPREQTWDDPLNNDVMQFDKAFEPIVLGDRVFLGFNDSDKVVAFDANTGDEAWAFYTDGPVRFPAVGWKDRVYFVSDDGFLYCVQATDGQLVWKFRGGPSARKVLGNKRVISMWPARGGPVIRDNTLYFAASIWPFLGTFIYAMDPDTGQVQWVNDGTGAQYHKQPHGAPSFAGVAPQGTLTATRDTLLVPGGRSVPAAFDRATGQLRHFRINDGGKGTGGSFVIASDTEFYVHTRLRGVCQFDVKTGNKMKFGRKPIPKDKDKDDDNRPDLTMNEPVLDGDTIYTATDKAVMAVDAKRNVQWQLKVDGSGDLIKAGDRLYVAGKNSIVAIRLPIGNEKPAIKWRTKPNGEVCRLVAGGGKLIAVTLDGRIDVYGENTPAGGPKEHMTAPAKNTPVASTQARAMLKGAGVDQGYAMVYGIDDPSTLDMLLAASDLRIVAFDPDAGKIDKLRRRYDALGLYGTRIALHQGDPLTALTPPYIASLVMVGKSLAPRYATEPFIQTIYNNVRPYGGVLWFPVAGQQQAEIVALVENGTLPKAKAMPIGSDLLVFREGALPESAPWTHLYGSIANTVKSDDRLVKMPLGILWFGGNSNMDVLPRHGHGPCPQVIGGRLFIEGMNSLSARDVYTGRVLWKREFGDLGTYMVYYDNTYANTPLDPAYNQVHTPGANSRGTNYVATAEAVYLAIDNKCLILDVKTGETKKEIKLPAGVDGRPAGRWAYLGVYDDVLLAGAEFGDYSNRMAGVKFKSTAKRTDAWSFDLFTSRGLVAFDRFTGEMLWRTDAQFGFVHNGIVAGNGRVYCLDKLPKGVEEQLARRGRVGPKDYRLLALDARTGEVVWERSKDIFGTWLGYSEQHDVLLQAGSASSDRSPQEVGQGMIAHRGEDGSTIWERKDAKYAGPSILHNDIIFTNSQSYKTTSGAMSLLNGSPVTLTNPITGKEEPWQFTRAYGCNTAVASEHMIMFRSGAAGYYDLNANCGVGNFGGFRASCSSNVIAADGVLNAPDYTRTCSCSYQNQTSLALVHMPDVETWTVSEFTEFGDDIRLERVGINLGAPGDRRAENGTLWIEYPGVAGEPTPVNIELDGDGLAMFRRHASAVDGPGLAWVAASGARNIDGLTIDVNSQPGARGEAGVKYTVGLHFAEPDDVLPGQRVFDVAIQGKTVLTDFDIVKEAGGRFQSVVRQFPGVAATDTITITLTPKGSEDLGPVLSGAEIVVE